MKVLKISRIGTFFVGMIMMIILFCCSNQVQAAQSGDYTYTITNGEAQITGYNHNATGAVTIPSTLDGVAVTSIGWSAFYNCHGITSISIPQGIANIGSEAFTGCTSLTNISVSVDNSTYESIEGVLYNKAGNILIACPGGLTSINIPQGVTSIGAWAFEWCTGLTSINIPDSVTSIGSAAFQYCTRLTSINIPEGVTSIGGSTYLGCGNLTNIIIPQRVESIGGGAFQDCGNLANIRFNSATTTIYDNAYTIPASTMIIGYDPSTAKDYATKYGRMFEVIATHYNVSIGTLTGGSIIASPASATAGTAINLTVTPYTGMDLKPGTLKYNDGTDHIIDGTSFIMPATDVTVTAEFTTTSRDYTYTVISETNKTACLNIIKNVSGTVVIPTVIDGYTITKLGSDKGNYNIFDNWWTGNYPSITSISIPTSVTSIGGCAFSGCSGLTSINIPSGVTSIDFGVFSGCSGLTSINIPDGVTSIGSSAFYGCNNLTSISLPGSLTSIGSQAFYDCSKITSISIPNGVTSIGTYAFYGCSGITSNISIPDGVTSIGDYTFYNCSGINSISIPQRVTRIGNYAFNGCSKIASINLPDGLTSIGNYAFRWSGLVSASIPGGVTTIGDSVFGGCSNLTSVIIHSGVNSIGTYAFASCPKLSSISIPDGVTSIGDSAFINDNILTNIKLPNSVIGIGNSAFSNCIGLTGISMPTGLRSIGNYAFNGCSKLMSISIPNGVTAIGNSAFYGCSGLTGSISIPGGVTTIGDSVFYGCSGLSNIGIPDGVTTIGNSTFYGCIGLTFISIPNGVTSIGNYVFCGCSALTYIGIPDGVTSIGNCAFGGCSGLSSINIPTGVTVISESVFGGCSNLTSIIIPDGVTSIGNYAFSGCTKLMGVNIPNSVAAIGVSAFDNCISITDIIIPKTLTSIGSNAFAYCNGLKSIRFNSATTTIYDSATTIPSTTKIIGYNPSNAKDYATKYGRTFETIIVIAPMVISTDPENDADGVELNKIIVITFNKNVIAGDTYNNIALKDESGTSVPISKNINGSLLTITPANNLVNNINYAVTIPQGAIKDQEDNPLTREYCLRFYTGNTVPQITIIPTNLSPGTVGVPYNVSLAASGDAPLYNWSAIGLPTGLVISSSTGVISGTPVLAETYDVSVAANDSAGQSVTANMSLLILPPSQLPDLSCDNPDVLNLCKITDQSSYINFTIDFSNAAKNKEIFGNDDTIHYEIYYGEVASDMLYQSKTDLVKGERLYENFKINGKYIIKLWAGSLPFPKTVLVTINITNNSDLKNFGHVNLANNEKVAIIPYEEINAYENALNVNTQNLSGIKDCINNYSLEDWKNHLDDYHKYDNMFPDGAFSDYLNARLNAQKIVCGNNLVGALRNLRNDQVIDAFNNTAGIFSSKFGETIEAVTVLTEYRKYQNDNNYVPNRDALINAISSLTGLTNTGFVSSKSVDNLLNVLSIFEALHDLSQAYTYQIQSDNLEDLQNAFYKELDLALKDPFADYPKVSEGQWLEITYHKDAFWGNIIVDSSKVYSSRNITDGPSYTLNQGYIPVNEKELNNQKQNTDPSKDLIDVYSDVYIYNHITSKAILTVSCPVTVDVYVGDKIVASLNNDEPTNQENEYGYFCSYYDDNGDLVKKVFSSNPDLRFVINGTGAGAMNLRIDRTGSTGLFETKASFKNVSISPSTVINVDNVIDSQTLNVDENGDGVADKQYTSGMEYYTVSIGSLSGGTITADPISATTGTVINLTVTPDAGMQLKAGTLKYNDGTDHVISGTSFTMPAANVIVTAEFEPQVTLSSATPTASVKKLNGNQNALTITVTELYSDGSTKDITTTLNINNNAAGTYTVGSYKVYVNTKGNTQIRECYIVK